MGLLLTLLTLVAGARGLQQPNIIIILADDIGQIGDTQQSAGCGDVVTSACIPPDIVPGSDGWP